MSSIRKSRNSSGPEEKTKTMMTEMDDPDGNVHNTNNIKNSTCLPGRRVSFSANADIRFQIQSEPRLREQFSTLLIWKLSSSICQLETEGSVLETADMDISGSVYYGNENAAGAKITCLKSVDTDMCMSLHLSEKSFGGNTCLDLMNMDILVSQLAQGNCPDDTKSTDKSIFKRRKAEVDTGKATSEVVDMEISGCDTIETSAENYVHDLPIWRPVEISTEIAPVHADSRTQILQPSHVQATVSVRYVHDYAVHPLIPRSRKFVLRNPSQLNPPIKLSDVFGQFGSSETPERRRDFMAATTTAIPIYRPLFSTATTEVQTSPNIMTFGFKNSVATSTAQTSPLVFATMCSVAGSTSITSTSIENVSVSLQTSVDIFNQSECLDGIELISPETSKNIVELTQLRENEIGQGQGHNSGGLRKTSSPDAKGGLTSMNGMVRDEKVMKIENDNARRQEFGKALKTSESPDRHEQPQLTNDNFTYQISSQGGECIVSNVNTNVITNDIESAPVSAVSSTNSSFLRWEQLFNTEGQDDKSKAENSAFQIPYLKTEFLRETAMEYGLTSTTFNDTNGFFEQSYNDREHSHPRGLIICRETPESRSPDPYSVEDIPASIHIQAVTATSILNAKGIEIGTNNNSDNKTEMTTTTDTKETKGIRKINCSYQLTPETLNEVEEQNEWTHFSEACEIQNTNYYLRNYKRLHGLSKINAQDAILQELLQLSRENFEKVFRKMQSFENIAFSSDYLRLLKGHFELVKFTELPLQEQWKINVYFEQEMADKFPPLMFGPPSEAMLKKIAKFKC